MLNGHLEHFDNLWRCGSDPTRRNLEEVEKLVREPERRKDNHHEEEDFVAFHDGTTT